MADWCRDKAKSLAVQDIINRWKVLNKIFADEVIGRLSKVEYALPNGAMSDLRHLLAESQRLQNQAVRPLQSAVDEVKGHPEQDCGCFGKRGRRFAGGKGGEQNAGSAGEARPEYRPRLE